MCGAIYILDSNIPRTVKCFLIMLTFDSGEGGSIPLIEFEFRFVWRAQRRVVLLHVLHALTTLDL
jgi:hypothetical protein